MISIEWKDKGTYLSLAFSQARTRMSDTYL